MLVTIQRLDKLAAARVYFTEQGMLQGTALSDAINSIFGEPSDLDDSSGESDDDIGDGDSDLDSDLDLEAPVNGGNDEEVW